MPPSSTTQPRVERQIETKGSSQVAQVGTARRAPAVLVLLACYNGERWVREQVESVLAQQEVDLHVAIRDDGSDDGTLEVIRGTAADGRVRISSPSPATGSATQNFLTLIRQHPSDGFDFIAFADQDDVWSNDKLARACRALRTTGDAGYSSATLATWPNGRTALLRQSSIVKMADYLLEGAGQGCTFVLRADFYERVRAFILRHRLLTTRLHYHDWAIYALARVWGYKWTFDPTPSVVYRQHDRNDTGARCTVSGALKRLKLLRNGWYRVQLHAIADLCAAAAPQNRTVLAWRARLLAKGGYGRRISLAIFCLRCGRRRGLDNTMLMIAALAGWI